MHIMIPFRAELSNHTSYVFLEQFGTVEAASSRSYGGKCIVGKGMRKIKKRYVVRMTAAIRIVFMVVNLTSVLLNDRFVVR